MMQWEWILAGCTGMALLAAAVDAALPRSRKAWWHAQPCLAFAPRHQRVDGLAPRALADAAPAVTLREVDTVERRAQALPFVGRDRRRAARAAARQRRAANDR